MSSHLTIIELAEQTGLPREWLRREALAGRVPCIRAGRQLLFDPAAVLAAVKAQPINPPTEVRMREGTKRLLLGECGMAFGRLMAAIVRNDPEAMLKALQTLHLRGVSVRIEPPQTYVALAKARRFSEPVPQHAQQWKPDAEFVRQHAPWMLKTSEPVPSEEGPR